MQVGLAVLLQRLLRPQHGLFDEALVAHPNGWLSRLRYVWYLGALGTPATLATLAFLGYVYTAGLLVSRALSTLWLAVGVAVTVGLLSQWVQRQSSSTGDAATTRADPSRDERGPGHPGQPEAPAVSDEPSPDIDLMDSQTRQLIRVGMTVITLGGVWLIWSEMIPAMGVPRRDHAVDPRRGGTRDDAAVPPSRIW